MMFSNAVARPVAFSKIGDFFSGGFTRTETPSIRRTGDAPKVEGPGGSKPAEGSDNNFDQGFVDKKVGFEGPGQATGHRQPGDAPDTEAPVTPEVAQHRETNRKKWQAQKDAGARDKLFNQPTPGRVNGAEVEPFSSKRLDEESSSLTKAVEKAAPARNSSLVRTAVIALPFSALGLIIAGSVNAFLKPLIDPSSSGGLTEQDLKDTRIVEAVQKDVSTAANAWSKTKGLGDPAPSEISWALKSNAERMDVLEEMVDILEKNLAADAKALGFTVEFASTGAPKEDIASRASAISSRLAVITKVFAEITAKMEASAA